MTHVAVGLLAAAVVAVSALPRVLAAAGQLPQELRIFGWSDLLAIWIDAPLAGHRLPYFDVPFYYPPVIGYVSGLLSWLVDSAMSYVAAWAVVVCAAAGATAYALSRACGSRDAIRYWALSPQLVLLSGLNFDVLASGFCVAGVLFGRRRRVAASGLTLALGLASKIFPAASAAALAAWLGARDRRALVSFAACFVAAGSVLYLPALLAPHSNAPYVAGYAVGVVANVDSVWGLVSQPLRSVGAPADGIVVIGSLVGMTLTFLFVVVPRSRRVADPALAAALATLCVLLWTRLYSPQYSLWVLPFFALCALPWRTFGLLSLADIGVFFSLFPLTLRGQDDPGSPLLLAALAAFVVLRHVALLRMWRDLLARTA